MPKTIDAQQVSRIARLARIQVPPDALGELGNRMQSILSYFDKLQELNTDGVEPMVHPVELRNVLADDQPGCSLTPQQALANAPARLDDLFRVPKVIGESQ
jgi:aspartyl-tRNA(Asn)/glutamyl-tRNA(Gln) amidotransferase subunit C